MVQSRNISTGQNIGGQENIYANKSFCLVFFFCIGPPGPPGASVSNMLVDVFTRVVVRNSSTIL